METKEKTNSSDLKLSSDQQEFLDRVRNGESIFLTGKAGTGKSHVLRQAIKELQSEGFEVAVLGTTGIAAMNVEGATMHSFFALPVKHNGSIGPKDCRFVRRDTREMWTGVDVIVIDEVSMLRADQLDAIEWTLNKNNCGSLEDLQVIFVGDLKQLPPIVGDEDNLIEYYEDEFFSSAKIYEDLEVTKVELTTVHRQSDREFIENLNHLRDTGELPSYFDQFESDESKGIMLCPYRAQVESYNRKSLARLEGKRRIFKPIFEGEIDLKHFNLPTKLVLKDGAKVMYRVNKKPLVNGSIGTIHFDDEEDRIFFRTSEGDMIRIMPHRFEKKVYEWDEKLHCLSTRVVGCVTLLPVTLAYAMTIHKSQGLTFDEMTVDLSQSCFVEGQLYVAMSRATGPDALNIVA